MPCSGIQLVPIMDEPPSLDCIRIPMAFLPARRGNRRDPNGIVGHF